MTSYEATLIPGDGIGPEVSEAARRAIDATGIEIRWDVQTAGAAVMDSEGTPLPDRVIESIRRTQLCYKGPVTTPVGTGFRSVNVALRKALDLYAAVRPVKSYPGTPSRYGHVDLIVIRENTEDVYAGVEFDYKAENTEKLVQFIEKELGMDLREDVGVSIKLISRYGTERVVRFAFEYAKKNGRRKVTAVHKANIMKASDGLFLDVAREVAVQYPEIQFSDLIVDNAAAQLVLRPETFDVLVLPNLYGDIISDLASGLIGGMGLAPGSNIGEKGAMFEPVHGSAPDIAGQDKANPTAAILSGMLMLRYLGETEAADRLERAISEVLREGHVATADLPRRPYGRLVGTREFTDAVIAEMSGTSQGESWEPHAARNAVERTAESRRVYAAVRRARLRAAASGMIERTTERLPSPTRMTSVVGRRAAALDRAIHACEELIEQSVERRGTLEVDRMPGLGDEPELSTRDQPGETLDRCRRNDNVFRSGDAQDR